MIEIKILPKKIFNFYLIKTNFFADLSNEDELYLHYIFQTKNECEIYLLSYDNGLLRYSLILTEKDNKILLQGEKVKAIIKDYIGPIDFIRVDKTFFGFGPIEKIKRDFYQWFLSDIKKSKFLH